MYYLCKAGRSSVSCSGSLVLGITPMMVLFNEVPFSSRCFTRCIFRGESTLTLTVEPGRSTPSWVSSSGRRLGILIPPPEDIVEGFQDPGHCFQHFTYKQTLASPSVSVKRLNQVYTSGFYFQNKSFTEV